MKRTIGIFIIFALVLSIFTVSVSAINGEQGAGSGMLDDDNDGIPNKDDQDYVKTNQNQDNMEDDDGDGIPNGQDEDFIPLEDGTQTLTKNMNSLKNQVDSMNQTNNALSGDQGVRNANAGIQGLKIMNQYTNSTLAQKVSQIANNYEKSYQKALFAEEQINQRSTFSRFLFGGDNELANSLDSSIGENRDLIQELLAQLVNATEEEKVFILEQIAELRTECDRLESVANEEASKKGLFKWW